MKKDILWTTGALAALSLATFLIVWPPSPNLQGSTAERDRPENRSDKASTGPFDAGSTSKSSSVSRKPVPKLPVHWTEAPYATEEDVFALVFQPRGFAASEDFAAIEPLIGTSLPRDVAERTEWVVAYGRAVDSELDIARNLTLVIRHAEPTTAVDVAAERYAGRTLTDEVLGDTPYLRVAETTEIVLMERVDEAGKYRETENTVRHEALAIVEHDPQTFLVVAESRLSRTLMPRRSEPQTPLEAALVGLPKDSHCAFVCREAKGKVLGTLVRAAGDRSAALAQPLLAMLNETTHVAATAGPGKDHLVQVAITLPTAESTIEAHQQLTTLRDQTRTLLTSSASTADDGAAARFLMESLQIEACDARLVITLPRPADLKSLFGKVPVSAP